MAAGALNGASRRRRLLLALLLAASALVVAGVCVRVAIADNLNTTALLWNLFLAWLPLVFAILVYDGERSGAAAPRLLLGGVLWLLFLPNAPYIVTDVEWLEWGARAFWYDTALIGWAAAIGLALGFVSLYLVQTVVTRRLGRFAGWGLAWAALVLSGVGVYLGRFERWNSWEVFTEPSKIVGELVSAALDPLAHGRPLAWATLFAVSCCVGYAIFYSAFRTHLERLDER
jgi:uncharacterized membrane protein